VPGVALKLESNSEGKFVVNGAPHCKELAPPAAECTVAVGSYAVDFLIQNQKMTHQVPVGAKGATDRFELGTVEAAEGKHVMIGGKSYKKAMFEVGLRQVTVSDDNGTHTVQVRVKPGATVTVK
jgi:hypothetical protein